MAVNGGIRGEASVDLDFEVTERNGHAVLRVEGEVDIARAAELREELIKLIDMGYRQVVVDLDDIEFLDSTGLGVLMHGLKRLRDEQGELALVCTQRRLLNVFETTGLAKVFHIHASVDSAVTGPS
jgi:anti-sigma B factor antagonist